MSVAVEKMAWVAQVEGHFEFTDLFARYTEMLSLKIREITQTSDVFVVRFTDGSQLRLTDEGQSCCEHRYITCDDDLQGYDGAQVVEVNLDVGGPEPDDDSSEAHEVQFVSVRTTRGTITLCTHNQHNGYYGGFNLQLKRIKP